MFQKYILTNYIKFLLAEQFPNGASTPMPVMWQLAEGNQNSTHTACVYAMKLGIFRHFPNYRHLLFIFQVFPNIQYHPSRLGSKDYSLNNYFNKIPWRHLTRSAVMFLYNRESQKIITLSRFISGWIRLYLKHHLQPNRISLVEITELCPRLWIQPFFNPWF